MVQVLVAVVIVICFIVIVYFVVKLIRAYTS